MDLLRWGVCVRVHVCTCWGDKPSQSTQRAALLTCIFNVFSFLIFFQINYIHEHSIEMGDSSQPFTFFRVLDLVLYLGISPGK